MKMRIVGISGGTGIVTVQTKLTKENDWEQDRLTFEEFEEMMKVDFPNYYKYYIIAKTNELKEITENGLEDFESNTYCCADWFYNFGETMEMRRKGECYIFTE